MATAPRLRVSITRCPSAAALATPASTITRVTGALHIHGDHFIEDTRRQLKAAHAQPLQNPRRDAGGLEAALHLAGIGDTHTLKREDLLELHAVLGRPEHFTDAENLSSAVLQARDLHHQLDGD